MNVILTSCCLVKLPVCLGLELMTKEPTVLIGQLGRLFYHPRALARFWGHNNFRTKHAHELSTFYGKRFSHRNHAVISTLGAHHCNRDACKE